MWLDKLKEMKSKCGMTTKDISEQSGIPEPTLEKLFAGATKDPKLKTMQQLVHFFGFTLDDLDDETSLQRETAGKDVFTLDEKAHIKKYRTLDEHGKEMVDFVIDREVARIEMETRVEEAPEEKVVSFPKPKKKTNRGGIVTIEVFEEPSAAGAGNVLSDAPASHMEQYPEKEIHSKTDFGVMISGHSMEPKYPDKCVVFVKSTPVVEPGDVGIFLLDGQAYIKQLHVDEEAGLISLHSLNPEYSDVPVDPYADLRVQGRVLGGYDTKNRLYIWK